MVRWILGSAASEGQTVSVRVRTLSPLGIRCLFAAAHRTCAFLSLVRVVLPSSVAVTSACPVPCRAWWCEWPLW